MQSALSNGGGLVSPLNSMIRKSINPVYDDGFNPVAGNSWPQFFKNALIITPPRTHTTPANFGGTPIVLQPAKNGAVLAVGTLMCGPGAPSATAPNLRIGYASNQSFEMRQGNSFQVHFAVAGAIGTSLFFASQYNVASSGHFGFSASNPGTNGLQNADTAWFRPAAGSMGLRSIVSPTSTQVLQIYNTFTDSSNYELLAFQFGTFSSARHAQIAAESAGTGTANINLVLTPKGTGAFILGPPPDGTTTGGNARGANAVDLCTLRSSATQVASGSKAYVGPAGGTASGTSSSVFGPNCTASGTAAGAGGEASSATGQSCFSWGQQVAAAGYGAAAFGESTATAVASGFASGKSSSAHSASTRAHAAANFANRGTGNIRGSAQMIDWTAAASAAPGVETQVFSTPGGSNSLSLTVLVPDNTVQSGVISIQAVNSSGAEVCHFLRQYAVKRISGTVSEVYSPVIIGTDSNAAGASIAITADNTGKAIKVTFTAPVATASVTGDAGTATITSAGHGFTNGQEIAFSNLAGGTGLANNILYFVRDATANTFKVTTNFPTNTATNFTTNITSGNVGYMWNVNAVFRMEEVRRGG